MISNCGRTINVFPYSHLPKLFPNTKRYLRRSLRFWEITRCTWSGKSPPAARRSNAFSFQADNFRYTQLILPQETAALYILERSAVSFPQRLCLFAAFVYCTIGTDCLSNFFLFNLFSYILFHAPILFKNCTYI